MNKRQKEILQNELNNEKNVIKQIKTVYERALVAIDKKIELLSANKMTQSKIYQKQYQEALKKQIEAILAMMNSEQYDVIQEYLKECYEDAFIGTLYDLQGQGIPLMFPINQEEVAQAIQHDTKLKKPLYEALGYNVEQLKKTIASEISRGIASSMMYAEIARNIRQYGGVSMSKALTIARTEGHRITEQARDKARHRAKEAGADVVKKWEAILDSRTRPTHQKLDGQIRELEEPFEVNGHKAMCPGGFGIAKEDINCRCAAMTRARWALEGGFTKYDGFTKELRNFSNPKDYDEFKKWYFSKENVQYMNYVEGLKKRYKTNDFKKLVGKMTDGEYNHFKKLESLSPMWKEHEKITKSINYAVETKMLDGRDFVRKFNSMTDDTILRREYLKNAKEMLKHRSGQNGEDLYLYNAKTKKWAKSTSGKEAGTPEYTDEIKNTILKSKKGELIAFHNHPASMPPSAADINAALHNGYSKGYVFCHNGTIFEYTAADIEINISAYNLRIADFQEKGYTEFKAQLETMNYYSKLYGFVFKEVK